MIAKDKFIEIIATDPRKKFYEETYRIMKKK